MLFDSRLALTNAVLWTIGMAGEEIRRPVQTATPTLSEVLSG